MSEKSQAESPPSSLPCHPDLLTTTRTITKIMNNHQNSCAQCKGRTPVTILSYNQIATHAFAAATGGNVALAQGMGEEQAEEAEPCL